MRRYSPSPQNNEKGFYYFHLPQFVYGSFHSGLSPGLAEDQPKKF